HRLAWGEASNPAIKDPYRINAPASCTGGQSFIEVPPARAAQDEISGTVPAVSGADQAPGARQLSERHYRVAHETGGDRGSWSAWSSCIPFCAGAEFTASRSANEVHW